MMKTQKNCLHDPHWAIVTSWRAVREKRLEAASGTFAFYTAYTRTPQTRVPDMLESPRAVTRQNVPLATRARARAEGKKLCGFPREARARPSVYANEHCWTNETRCRRRKWLRFLRVLCAIHLFAELCAPPLLLSSTRDFPLLVRP